MKRIFQTTFHLGFFNLVLLVVRVSIAGFMLEHGIPKFKKFFASEEITFADPLGFGPVVSLGLTIFAEVVCSAFILVGLGTRIFVVPLIVLMLIIVFVIHAADGFREQELALHYLLVYVLLFSTGSGKYSIDHYLQKKL